jgi:hypothetical protein
MKSYEVQTWWSDGASVRVTVEARDTLEALKLAVKQVEERFWAACVCRTLKAMVIVG